MLRVLRCWAAGQVDDACPQQSAHTKPNLVTACVRNRAKSHEKRNQAFGAEGQSRSRRGLRRNNSWRCTRKSVRPRSTCLSHATAGCARRGRARPRSRAIRRGRPAARRGTSLMKRHTVRMRGHAPDESRSASNAPTATRRRASETARGCRLSGCRSLIPLACLRHSRPRRLYTAAPYCALGWLTELVLAVELALFWTN